MIPRNEKRNSRLLRLRDGNPKRWTFEALGEKFKIKGSTAFEIYHREKARNAGRSTKAPVPSFIAKKYPALTHGRRVFSGRRSEA